MIFMTCAVTASAVACSTSPSAPSAPSAPAAPSATTGGAGTTGSTGSTGGGTAGAEQAVATNWTAFFDAKTSVARRVQLLEDGPEFQAIIQAQEGSSIASQASATVTKVTLTSPQQARVSYSILLAGTPALPGQTGTAVYEDGLWKVGVQSFCALLSLENGGSTSSLPSACSSAG